MEERIERLEAKVTRLEHQRDLHSGIIANILDLLLELQKIMERAASRN